MRKTILISIIISLVICILGVCGKVDAAAGITYYMRDAIIVENTENIKIQEYNTVINTEKSTVEDKILLANMAKEDTVTEIRVPLDYKELGIAVKDLEITVNNLKINNIVKNEKGEYVFKVKINAGEGKKIEIKYSTENDLRNAKVIKYNFSNVDLNDRSIGKLKFDVIFLEEDIPLVKEIYPGHYTFDNNTVTVEYYNFTINSLTENILIEKDTYSDLLKEIPNLLEEALDDIDQSEWFNAPGREEDKKGGIERTKTEHNECAAFLKNVPAMIKNVANMTYPENDEEIQKLFGFTYYNYIHWSAKENIKEYILDKLKLAHNRGDEISIYEGNYSLYRPLIIKWKVNNWKKVKTRIETELPTDENNNFLKDENGKIVSIQKKVEVPLVLKDKIVCIDYTVEREDKELHFLGSHHDETYDEIVTEYNLYNFGGGEYWGEYGDEMFGTIVTIGEYGNKLIKATPKEKADYANMINTDFYIKYDLYDLSENESEGYDIGYYTAANREIAEKFDGYMVKYMMESQKVKLKELEQDETLSLLEIPAVVSYIGNLKYEDGKYVARNSGDATKVFQVEGAENAIKTARAQELINENHSKNERTKQMMEKKIADLIITDDIEEYVEEEEPENIIVEENAQEVGTNSSNNAYIDIIVLSAFGVSFLVCIILLIINIRKRI